MFFGTDGVNSEIPFLCDVCSNLNGKNGERHCVVGSFSGALSFRAQIDADKKTRRLTQMNSSAGVGVLKSV